MEVLSLQINKQTKMSRGNKIAISVVALMASIGYLTYITLSNDESKKAKEKTRYEKTLQEDYNIEYDSVHPIVETIPTRYLNLDSIKLRTETIEGCRWLVRINGTGSDKYIHTISNCPKCRKFLLSLKCECK